MSILSEYEGTSGNDVQLHMADTTAEDPETLVYESTKEQKNFLSVKSVPFSRSLD